MRARIPERRMSHRHSLKIPLHLRIWGSSEPAHKAESVDLSERGVLLETTLHLDVGSVVDLLLRLPEAITGQPTTEWRCRGHVVRTVAKTLVDGRKRLGLQFDSLGVP